MTKAVLWCAVLFLVFIGVAAVTGRALFLDDFVTRANPLRERFLSYMERDDPFASERVEEVRQFDRRFAAHPVMTLLHILPGGVFLILAPFQFSSRIRSRYIHLHRWSGRVLVLAGVSASVAGLYFGLLMPFGGTGEAIAIALFGALFIVAACRAVLAIRRGHVALHREWMIRAFAVALGISTVRAFDAALDFTLTPSGFRSREIFVLAIWTGWLLTLGVAEGWIRHTRPSVDSGAEPLAFRGRVRGL